MCCAFICCVVLSFVVLVSPHPLYVVVASLLTFVPELTIPYSLFLSHVIGTCTDSVSVK